MLNKYKNIHFIGIGGIGLSAIAEIFISNGHTVSGSDIKESDIILKLKEKGITFYSSHEATNVADADMVVYTSAVSMNNPEIIEAREKEIPLFSRSQVLGMLMSHYKTNIAISGTHGKTTTTSMLSLILNQAHFEPTFLIGGLLPEINGNVKIGSSEYFITEACEYMDNFLDLQPNIEIILNIDSDHLDYFKDIDHIARSFEEFIRKMPEDGVLFAYVANPIVTSIVNKAQCKVLTFGFDRNCDYHAQDIKFNILGMPSFQVYYRDTYLFYVSLSTPGEHNIANALATIACAHYLQVPSKYIIQTLKDFKGTMRRFDSVGIIKENVHIIDDYAHHPEEIKATLKATQNIKHNQTWCIFQPHTYTRTLALFDDFAQAFGDADKIIITDIYAAREKNIYKVEASTLADKIKEYFPEKEVFFIKTFPEIVSYIIEHTEKDDFVLTLGAGDIYQVAESIVSSFD